MSIQELEAAVSQLRPDQLVRFRAWFEEFLRVGDRRPVSEEPVGNGRRTAVELAESPLVGLWRDRDDIGHSADYARHLRERAQRRQG